MTASARASVPSLAAMALLLAGLPAGGLRDPRAWLGAAAAVWLAALHPRARLDPEALRAWAPWLAWALLSAALCSQPAAALAAVSRWATLAAYFALCAALWRSAGDRRRWFLGLSFSAALLGAGALLLPPAALPGSEIVIHPMTGFIPPYYNYTLFVEAAFLAGAFGVLSHPRRPRGRGAALLLGLAAFALLLILKARSRGALLAACAACAAGLLRRGRTRWLVGGLLLLAAALAWAPADWLGHVLKLEMSEWFKRPQIWRAAAETAMDHPWLGEGLDNFEIGFRRHNFPVPWPVRYGFFAARPESDLFGLAAETGWIGLGLFLAAAMRSLGGASAEPSDPYREGAVLALVAMGTHCLVDSMLHLPALALLFFSALACARRPSKGAGVWRAPRTLYWAGLAAAVAGPLPVLWARGALAREVPDPRREMALLERAAAVLPADAELRRRRAAVLLRQQPPDATGALRELERARALDPTNALVPAMQAEVLLWSGRRAEALPALGSAIGLEPNFFRARLLRARIWISEGKRAAAAGELSEIRRRRRALEARPSPVGDWPAGYERAILRFDEGLAAALEAEAGGAVRP